MAKGDLLKSMKNSSPTFQNTFLNVSVLVAIFVLFVFTLFYIYIITQEHKLRMRKRKQQNKEDFVIKTSLRIVYVYSSSCPHCKRLDPVFENAVSEFVSSVDNYNIEVEKVNAKELNDSKYVMYVDGFPTILIFLDGHFIKKEVGFMDENRLLAFFSTAL